MRVTYKNPQGNWSQWTGIADAVAIQRGDYWIPVTFGLHKALVWRGNLEV